MKNKNVTNFKSYLKQLDMFSATVHINIKGKTRVSTWFGTVVSLLLYVVLIAFSLYRFQLLITHEATTFTTYTQVGGFDTSYVFDFDSNNFNIAIGFLDVKTNESILDPYFLQLKISKSSSRAGTKTNLNFHVCTQDDMKDFYQVDLS